MVAPLGIGGIAIRTPILPCLPWLSWVLQGKPGAERASFWNYTFSQLPFILLSWTNLLRKRQQSANAGCSELCTQDRDRHRKLGDRGGKVGGGQHVELRSGLLPELTTGCGNAQAHRVLAASARSRIG